MAAADHDSGLQLSRKGIPASSTAEDSATRGRQIWLDGDVLACACPDCGAPMSIRLWLMVADCWRCGTSIELTEEHQRQAMRLLRQRQELRWAQTRQAAAAITPSMLRKPKGSAVPEPKSQRSPPCQTRLIDGVTSQQDADQPDAAQAEAPPAGPRPAAAGVAYKTQAKIRRLYERDTVGALWSDLFKDLPAWMISLVVHLVGMLLLGLWMVNPPGPAASITLATSISHQVLEGEQGEPDDPLVNAFEFEDPGAIPLDELTSVKSPGQVEVELEGVAMNVPNPIGTLPEPSDLSVTLPSAPRGYMFAGRDPRLRAQIVRREGGTSFTEAAVARGLRWLARHQNANGSWSLDAWHKAPGARGKGDGLGGKSDTAGTALALLPFLGAGQTHYEGEYRQLVFRGLKWLVENQGYDGDLRGPGIGRMYAHGLASIVLCEAFAMTGDEQLRLPAQKALDFIVKAQHSAGGWRYDPGQAGDTSMIGWQLIALRSGRMAYLSVPQKTFLEAERFLNTVQTDRYGGLYSYRPGGSTSHVMTAEALLCRQYLGWPRNNPGLRTGVQFLLDKHLPDMKSPNIYYWYYATQVMHHMGGRAWSTWNSKIRSVLVDMQETEGPMAGSWEPRGGHSRQGGRIYMTSLAICTLEVYYRHLPMYRHDIVQEYKLAEQGQ